MYFFGCRRFSLRKNLSVGYSVIENFFVSFGFACSFILVSLVVVNFVVSRVVVLLYSGVSIL